MHAKPLNYGKLANIEQEEKEGPGKFLDRLREALYRFTEIDHKSEEGKVILKDRFLTQSAPDIHRKLLKRAYGPNQSLDNLLQVYQTVYYGREYEEKKERQKKTKEQAEALTMAMRTFLKAWEKCPEGPKWKGMGLLLLWEGGAPQAGLPSGIQATTSSMSSLRRTTLEDRLSPEA